MFSIFFKKKAAWGWVFYDWANSAFATTVMAGFFPIFFKQYWSCGTDVNLSTARLGFGNAVASLIVALTAPVLGAMADRGALKKTFLVFFAYLGVLMTASLFMVQKGAWAWALCLYGMGLIGYAGANVFYDAMLPDIAAGNDIDSLSSMGYAMGYLGGGLLFLLNVVMTLQPEAFGLPDSASAVRWSFISVALWWGLFSILTLLWVPGRKAPCIETIRRDVVSAGLRQLIRTLRQIRHLKTVCLFLLAYWFYIDGVGTIIRMAVDYGMSLGFAANDLIVALLIVQFVGFPAALVFGRLGQRWGVRKSIYLAIGIYIGVALWGFMMTRVEEFYGLAVVIGLVQGGIQALSRSYYSRLIPPRQAAEFYGFYNMLGKFAAILGPALVGGVGLAARRLLISPESGPSQIVYFGHLASRLSIVSVALLFIAGGVLFYFVDENSGRAQAALVSDD